MLGHDRLRSAPEGDLRTQVGEPLGHRALGCPHQEDRLLLPVAPPHEARLLAGVLGVVARVGLVGDQVAEREREDGQVEVDRHPAAQVALVVVEP